MSLELQERRTRNVPNGSTLLVKVSTNSNQVNATGRVSHAGGGSTDLTHGAIFKRVKKIELEGTGVHIARVNLILNGETQQTATVEYSIEDSGGSEIRSWQPEFKGKSSGNDKFIGRAKWTISVV